jgi:inner membrane transporter RhtA
MSSERIPPHLYFVVSAVFHYLGPAFAVLLFSRVSVLGVAWLRIAAAGIVFAAWRRPWRALAGLDRAGRSLLLGWGAVLAVMNCCFYLAIDRLPLATVAAIEFLPVIALAALGARTIRNALALLLAVPGVYLLTGLHVEGEALGVALAFANAAFFAAYIVLAHRVARLELLSGIDGLALSMLVALLVVTPLAGWAALPAFADPLPLRQRPARDAAARPRDVCADGLVAAGHRHRDRSGRAGPGALVDGGRGRCARDRRGRGAPGAPAGGYAAVPSWS